MKNVSIIGDGISAWTLANAFSESNFSVQMICSNKSVFGAQQISPNGFNALISLIKKRHFKNKIEKINRLKVRSIEKNTIKNLSDYDISKNFGFYGSISRKALLTELRESALKNKNVQVINDEIITIHKENKNINKLLTKKGRILESNFIFGCDG